MDSEQKSTEAKKTIRFDVEFMEYLSYFNDDEQEEILTQVVDNDDILPELNGLSQYIGGRLENNEVYFELEYIKQVGEQAIYLDVVEIELDEYLDLIIEKKHYKKNGTGIQKRDSL
jgi:hypothetical protein